MSFVPLEVFDIDIERAKAIRLGRDKEFGNYYAETAADARWVGDLGEIVFNDWSRRTGLVAYWNRDDPKGNADFTLNGQSIELKTTKRRVPPQLGYDCHATARQVVKSKADHYFFASYQTTTQTMWLLGGIRREDFILNAQYHGPGEQVNPNFKVRDDNAIYNISNAELTPPEEWRESLG